MSRTGLSLRAIYPGSFDPVTNGHLDILGRAAKTFDEVIVAVLHNPAKSALFTVEERLAMLSEQAKRWPNVQVATFTGLTAEYARQIGASVIIRGLRAVSDFDAEFRIALTNRKLNPDLDTVFLMTTAEYLFLSSSGVKEIASFGGSVHGLVPTSVAEQLTRKYSAHNERLPAEE